MARWVSLADEVNGKPGVLLFNQLINLSRKLLYSELDCMIISK